MKRLLGYRHQPELAVTLASIDEAPHARPARHVHAGSKAPWYSITDTLPRFQATPGQEPPAGP